MKKGAATLEEAKNKLENYCVYQDRCHAEVAEKLRSIGIFGQDADTVIVYLIDQNFLNEERFAKSFARGKHRIKYWGKNRIVNELKARHISDYNIRTALKEISADEYETTFENLASRHWESIAENNQMKKRKKFCDYLLRKGFESDLVWEKVKELERDELNQKE